MLVPGDPAPHFKAASSVNRNFNFDTVAGRYVVLSFFGSSRHPVSERVLAEIKGREERFDVTNAIFFGVSTDPNDSQRIAQETPGIMYFWDLDQAVSRAYGVVQDAPAPTGDGQLATENAAPDASAVAVQSVAIPRNEPVYAPRTFVLDYALRVVAVIPYVQDAAAHVNTIFQILDSMPELNTLGIAAPVLIVPYVFEPELCQTLVNYYETHDAEDSGFMRDVNGKTVGLLDYSHKRRMDCEITDQKLIQTTQERIKRRVVPAIRQAYQFNATRIERHIVACYDAAQGAHFRAHRDNTTLGTAHRRFAITINLNSPDYEGGEIWFPEFGPRKYKAPSGAAIVFGCSLLHEVPKVTKCKRYAFLPFLYDDAAAAIRERNRRHLGDLSGATGAKVTHVCDTPTDSANSPFSRIVIDGSAGCGNPEGCQTCLTSATYQLGTPPRTDVPQQAN